jgi:hypothetical protein
MLKTQILFFIVVATLISSCHKSKIDPYSNATNDSPVVTVDQILAQITDQNGAAIENASVMLNGATEVSDANGVVQFTNTTLPSKNALITISANGFFKQNYLIDSETGDSRSVKIKTYSSFI